MAKRTGKGKKGLSLTAAAWWYNQSFNGGTRETSAVQVQPTASTAHTHEIEPLDEPEWSDTDTTREMYASISPPR